MNLKPGPISGPSPTLVWFRQDLRLEDNPALTAACKRRGPVIPVFIWAPDEEGAWPPGGASKWWLHQSLAALDDLLRSRGSKLILRVGSTRKTLERLITETRAGAVFWNRRYEPKIRQRDSLIEQSLSTDGCVAGSFNGALLREPFDVLNKSGKPFQVFTPYWRCCLALTDPEEPQPIPTRIVAPTRWPASSKLRDLNLAPVPDWAGGLRSVWRPGSLGAANQLEQFMESAFDSYSSGRNRPDLPGTARLSPHLHFGEISPRQIWHALKRQAAAQNQPTSWWHQSQFLAELGWREFSHHLLVHFPQTDSQPLREEFSRFRWHTNPAWLRAWQQGRTGYPFVDAGMRQLWATGWMHNRVRMVAASFLVKDLLLDWQAGARWFWDTLVDADLAQNTLGWQWTAGCGADAAPYFRIFNPTSQGEKFDPQGAYIRKWVPELFRLPDKWIHEPSSAPSGVLADAGVRLGATYPEPIVQHRIAREVALEAYARVKKNSGQRPKNGASSNK